MSINSILRESFKNRFSSQVTPNRTLNLDFLQPLIMNTEAQALLSPFSNEEIKASFFDMNPLKAPGSDGYGPLFFQKYWSIIGGEVSTAVKSFFDHGKLPLSLNHTVIALIPKVDAPENPNHYRPISLCNTVYKAIAKLLVSRLTPVLLKHVSPYQNAFTPQQINP